MVFTHDMADWLSFNIDEAWLAENISWKDFGTGVRLGKLKREEKTSLVLYEAQSEVEVDAFMPHSHPGGECYVVLEGEVWDEDGSYPTGSIVWMDPESTHTPKASRLLDEEIIVARRSSLLVASKCMSMFTWPEH